MCCTGLSVLARVHSHCTAQHAQCDRYEWVHNSYVQQLWRKHAHGRWVKLLYLLRMHGIVLIIHINPRARRRVATCGGIYDDCSYAGYNKHLQQTQLNRTGRVNIYLSTHEYIYGDDSAVVEAVCIFATVMRSVGPGVYVR